MSNKKQFEELITNTPKENYVSLWCIVGALQFNPAFRNISGQIKKIFLEGVNDKDIIESIKNDDPNVYDDDPEWCRDVILDSFPENRQKE